MEGQRTENNMILSHNVWIEHGGKKNIDWLRSLCNRQRLQSWLGIQLNCGCVFRTLRKQF